MELEPAFRPTDSATKVYVAHKPAEQWSNKSRQGSPLQWPGLHAKARDFLSTESTFQELSDESQYAAYAVALINGVNLVDWHTLPAWREKAERAKREPVIHFNAKQRGVARMVSTAYDTVAGANGQVVERTLKRKEMRFGHRKDFEAYVAALVDSQDGLCAVTGLRLQFDSDHDDRELLCSLDRIDSDGHYEQGNLQVVCKFVNRWKSDDDDTNFRRLIAIVRRSRGDSGDHRPPAA